MEVKLRNKLEEASRRGRQVHCDGGGGLQIDRRKRAGDGRIAVTRQCPGGRMTLGRCGVVWCDVDHRRGQRGGQGSGLWC